MKFDIGENDPNMKLSTRMKLTHVVEINIIENQPTWITFTTA
jgi:hypothetical protein